ncbi:ATPase [Marinobacter changyiensis]|uniref:ATPase n=1 Tax=Marinobacter changyiensis TaxID=2604091 RepID=UPI0012658FD8|nr:ATPase [Marinobacter changyiensis]
MDIKTFRDLIEWTRDLHRNLSNCLADCSKKHEQERARALLDYLAKHEAELERIVTEFERQADNKILETRVYDHMADKTIQTLRTCDEHYTNLDFDGICREVFEFHDQVIELYQYLAGRAEIPEAEELFDELLKMEQNESMRLARQVGQMNDI